MKPSKLLTLLSALAISATATAATTDAVGFVSVTVPANSDAILAVPLNRAAEFKGVIQTIAGNVITVAGTPAWTANAFAPGVTANKTYAVQIASGAKEGLIGRVTANGVNTLTITLDSGEDLTGIGSVDVPVDPDGVGPLTAQADQVDIMPYWTPAAIFTTSPPADTQLMLFSGTVPGLNIAPSKAYTFDAEWYDDDTFANADHLALKFGQGLVVRNKAAAPLALSMVGSVPMSKTRNLFRTIQANKQQDAIISISSPVPEKIGNFGAGFADGVEIQVYNNSATGYNKAPSKIYFYETGVWYDGDTFANVTDTVELQPGFGYLIRIPGTTSPTTYTQTTLPKYLQP